MVKILGTRYGMAVIFALIFYFVLPDKYYFSVMRHERTIMLVTMLLLFSGALDTVLGTVTGGVMTLFNFMIGLVPFL